MKLQINLKGSWRHIVDFDAARRDAVLRALPELARALGDDNGRWSTAPPAQARDARRSVGAVVQRVRDAELFDDGVDADLATNGVTTLADAFLRGRLAACDEIEAAMAREGE